MAVVQGIREKVHLPIYDSVFVEPDKQLRESTSSTIGTLKFFVNVQSKTKLETNLQSASLLPHYNTFEARAMRVVISDLPPKFPEEITAGKADDELPVTDDGRQTAIDGDRHASSGETGFDEDKVVTADIEFDARPRSIELLQKAREASSRRITLDIVRDEDDDHADRRGRGADRRRSSTTMLEARAAASIVDGRGSRSMIFDDDLDRKAPPTEQISPHDGAGTLISKFIYNTVTTLYVGEKIMIQMPTWFFPAGAGAVLGRRQVRDARRAFADGHVPFRRADLHRQAAELPRRDRGARQGRAEGDSEDLRAVLHLGRARRLHDARRPVVAARPWRKLMAVMPAAMRRRAAGAARGRTETGSAIPYDAAASFETEGRPGRVVAGVINIDVDGTFVATAIGYGLEEDRRRPLDLPEIVPGGASDSRRNLPARATSVSATSRPTCSWMASASSRIRPCSTRVRHADRASALERVIAQAARGNVLEHLVPRSEVSFFFSIVDSNSGRELQDEPIHNLASLGKTNGERPFRVLPRPLSFAPRSTVRLQVIENSEGVRGTLFIVLYGYKILAASHCPEPVVRALQGTPECPGEIIGLPADRITPFDYVANLQLVNRPGRLITQDVNVNVEGGFVATALGYALQAESRAAEAQRRHRAPRRGHARADRECRRRDQPGGAAALAVRRPGGRRWFSHPAEPAACRLAGRRRAERERSRRSSSTRCSSR